MENDQKLGDRFSSLSLVGYSMEIHDNPELADYYHKEEHLIPWNGERHDLMIDRYDVRATTSDYSVFMRKKKKKKKKNEQEEEWMNGMDEIEIGF